MPPKLILILGTIVALGPLSIDMYLPGLPRLQEHFGTTPGTVKLTLASYFLGLALGQLLYGPFSDRFGRRPPLIFGLLGYSLASIGCALAPSIEALIALRFVQAMTGCAGMVIARAIVRDWCEPQDMARVLSLLVLVMGIAPILAPALGSQVLLLADWPALFLVLAGASLLMLLLIIAGVDESLPAERRNARISLAESLQHYRQILSHRRFLGYALSGGLAQAGLFAYIASSSFIFMDGYGLSEVEFSALFGANAFGLILTSQINRWVLQRVPAQQVLYRAISAYGLFAVMVTIAAATGAGGLWGIAIPLAACLACLGFTFPNSTSAAMAPFGDRAGTASALLGTMQFGIAGIASTVVGHFDGSNPLPMAVAITLCAGCALALLRWVRSQ